MKIIDLSQPLFDGAPNCPAHTPVKITLSTSHAWSGADGWHLEHLSFTSHTGSHVDAPLHKLQNGKAIDGFPLEQWTGPARIVDFRGIAAKTLITRAMLEKKLPAKIANEWILLATGFGDKRAKTQEWLHDAPGLAPDAARWLASREARGVGIDHFSIGDAEVHAALLRAPVLIVEELHFPKEVFDLPQPLQFMALPINLRAHSGAPCRPVLLV